MDFCSRTPLAHFHFIYYFEFSLYNTLQKDRRKIYFSLGNSFYTKYIQLLTNPTSFFLSPTLTLPHGLQTYLIPLLQYFKSRLSYVCLLFHQTKIIQRTVFSISGILRCVSFKMEPMLLPVHLGPLANCSPTLPTSALKAPCLRTLFPPSAFVSVIKKKTLHFPIYYSTIKPQVTIHLLQESSLV